MTKSKRQFKGCTHSSHAGCLCVTCLNQMVKKSRFAWQPHLFVDVNSLALLDTSAVSLSSQVTHGLKMSAVFTAWSTCILKIVQHTLSFAVDVKPLKKNVFECFHNLHKISTFYKSTHQKTTYDRWYISQRDNQTLYFVNCVSGFPFSRNFQAARSFSEQVAEARAHVSESAMLEGCCTTTAALQRGLVLVGEVTSSRRDGRVLTVVIRRNVFLHVTVCLFED